jgi:hypothetical protein
MDPLQTYVVKVVKLGQETLALYRRGLSMPDELAALAQELLALEKELGLPSRASPAIETAGLEESSHAIPSKGEEDILVLDVEEEAGGGPAFIREPLDALPPLVVDVADEELQSAQREIATPSPGAIAHSPLSAGSTDDPGVCRRCGEALRPGSRFCHHCGQRRDAPI